MREDSIIKDIKKLSNDIFDIKSKQFIGTDSVKTYNIQTNNTWDWTRTASGWFSGQSQEAHNIYMKFIADNQNAPIGIAVITCLIDNSIYFITDTGNASSQGQFNGVWFNGTISDVYGNYSPDIPIPNLPNEMSWYDAITLGSLDKKVQLKFNFYTTDTGTLKIEITGVGGAIITS